jgi:hypothetical protein
MDDQSEVIAFLSKPAAYASRSEAVGVCETHGALVFLAGGEAWKMKRAVRFPYMDFSTLERRRAVLVREFEVNRPFAPGLYLDVVPVTRDAGGALAVGGDGQPVEWLLHMRRFAAADLMSEVARSGRLDRALARRLADAVRRAHAAMPVVADPHGAARIARTISGVTAGLDMERAVFAPGAIDDFRIQASRRLGRCAEILDRRAAAGRVRRCHGDLHLGNLVLLDGEPTLFDAIEFSEEIATIDTLYDIAFLVMDLDVRGQREAANVVLNAYLGGAPDALDLDGLAALPLFLALRAAIRAMVGAERAAQETGRDRDRDVAAARHQLETSLRYLDPPSVAIVAVGGFSGSGKSTLAASLAPAIGAAPGAIHLRTDLVRKALHAVGETDRLPPAAYTAAASEKVYAEVLAIARRALAAGHCVVIDAVLSQPEERRAIELLASDAGAAFKGLWLEAPRSVLETRVSERRGDASDATAEVVAAQLARGAGDVAWARVDAGGSPAETLAAARACLPPVIPSS